MAFSPNTSHGTSSTTCSSSTDKSNESLPDTSSENHVTLHDAPLPHLPHAPHAIRIQGMYNLRDLKGWFTEVSSTLDRNGYPINLLSQRLADGEDPWPSRPIMIPKHRPPVKR